MSDVRSLLSRKNLTIPEALRPTFVNGKWRSPVLTPRKAKKLRKHMLICGESWDDDWLINSGKMTVMRVPKGHKRDLIREDRVDMILNRLDMKRTKRLSFIARMLYVIAIMILLLLHDTKIIIKKNKHQRRQDSRASRSNTLALRARTLYI